MSLTSRPFAGEFDYEQMRAMLIDSARLNRFAPYCSLGDLDWWRWTAREPNQIDKTQIWLEGERVVGFVWPGDSSSDVIVHPDFENALDEMLEWAEADVRSRAAPGAVDVTFETWAFSKHDAFNGALTRRGYEQGEAAYRMRAQSIDGAIASPELPLGYAFRDMRNATEDDVQMRVEVHRAAFAPSRMTVEKHTAVMAAPTYRPELDLVIVAPDDSFAAFTIVWFDEANRFGVFEPVGTHPDHQRLGLARAILGEGLHRLVELGATSAYVISAAGGPGANLLYAAAGFQVVDEQISWTKSLS